MIIKEIELNNFRIYRGKNKINLAPDGERNIVIISGNNGFGKTTFLMSLVWCLYGRQMEKVDDLYRQEIEEKGGYSKYIGNSLNFQAKKEGQTRFSVSVTFTGVEIPDTTCTEITIIRSYDSATNYDDELEIYIDGKKNDLFAGTKEEIAKEEEVFIRDYILPIEIAKFFFFDAEKIVSFAQINTPEQRRELSKAYSQVLGIQKYDDLKNEIERIQDDYRREAAKPQERKELGELISSIKFNESELSRLSEEIAGLENSRVLNQYEAKGLQEKLIREGDLMTQDELEKLNKKREYLYAEMRKAEEGLKELYNLIPFGLAGGLVADIIDQLNEEKAFKQNRIKIEGVNDKTDKILSDIEHAKHDLPYTIDLRVRDFYESQIRALIKKHFYDDLDSDRFEHFTAIHAFSDLQENDFSSLVSKIKESKSLFDTLYTNYTKDKAEVFSIERKIREAEKNAESDYIQELRLRKEQIDRQIDGIYREIASKESEKDIITDAIIANKKKKEILSKKISVSDQNKDVDEEATRLIRIIQKFLIKFKEEKKKALAKKLEGKLKLFLHKTSLVDKVVVDINGNGEDVDINLYNKDGRKIDKGNLSMGERQMFASALLGALVDETEIEFPVFIDSPMQKFDASHTKNVLTQFYPTVSKQVVLFPLLTKELTEGEYGLIQPIVSKAYLIENSEKGSVFKEVKPVKIFAEYKKRGYAN